MKERQAQANKMKKIVTMSPPPVPPRVANKKLNIIITPMVDRMKAMRLKTNGRYLQTEDGIGYIVFTIILYFKFGFFILAQSAIITCNYT